MTTPHERLRRAREQAGYATAKEAAVRMNVPVATYIQHENGARGFGSRAERYAGFFHTTPEWLLYGRGEAQAPEPAWGGMAEPGAPPFGMQPITRYVPVLGDVQAGAWTEVYDDVPEPEELLPVFLVGFDGARLFALRIRGPSMDRFYPDGSIVIVCPAAEIGVREGDHVVVRRRRGALVETTIKEVVREADGVALWPRSNDPRFQEPIRLASIRDADDGPEIIAVVVSSYNIRPIQQRPLIQL